ncbi:hypothetical protein O181_026228 [Austropuccinia psidii MF-1]|uniref:Transposase Tc1-like domain-containing protein n=1 Tax=Austropuccinia psidii MF-1 TaxID=1389203 RepID=A0A9Q3CM57_9BASI|nr:hypothetical protein [Austropuccinia psidii MF-1]
MPYLDIKTRACLLGMQQAGLSFRNISNFNCIPLTTVYDTIIKYQQLGTTQTQKKSGRPTKLTDRDRQELSQIITQECRLTLAQVTNLMTKVLSTQTIQCKIHKLGNHSCIAPKKPYLRPQDFQRHLGFAQAHCHWAKVIWTAQLAFKLGKQVNWVRVWRTASKKWNLENLAVNHQSGQQLVMIWGAFCGLSRSTITFLNGRMNATELVRQVYQPSLQPFVEHMEKAPWIRGPQCLLLMEDNAPIHTVMWSKQWRE